MYIKGFKRKKVCPDYALTGIVLGIATGIVFITFYQCFIFLLPDIFLTFHLLHHYCNSGIVQAYLCHSNVIAVP